ncbi:cyclic nucleotide-binding domain-containing protein [Nitrospirillum sp. BR 11828]|uniref:cyclic nucleotide-binding domain-containing protein n=1 Tax=Nitrospirillum sp. BR 11828 TaxID=3104325 RepID=UPI002ACA0850|nr:cyclic nucleotide-binding domain-containing protein [Nitrospirillum sp. BR 11828]MDZ5649848.1 cyclic nucleotide-binding domain-containing protein [Nitrospirillum sp. BR 11828]
MRPDDASEIRALPLFRDIREETFADLVTAGFLQRFPSGVTLIQERERADFLHIVTDGLVEMYAGTEGEETTLDLVQPLGTFILAAVLKDQVYLQSARTIEKSRIVMIPAEKVRQAMTQDAAFMTAIVMELAGGYRQAIRDLKNLKLRTGTERLANWMLGQAGEGNRVPLPCEKRVLASRLGMTPENLSRGFATLRAHGVVVSGSDIEITHRDALIRYARPDPLIDQREADTRFPPAPGPAMAKA